MNPDFERLASQEWLLTNGIGGFASGTVAGCATRRYHSLLTVALDPPTGRRMSLLGGLDETVILEDGTEFPLSTHVYEDGTVFPDGWARIFDYPWGGSVYWHFHLPNKIRIWKQTWMPAGENTYAVQYRIISPKGAIFQLAPLICWKEIHSEMAQWAGFPLVSQPSEIGWEVQPTFDSPKLCLEIASQSIHNREEPNGVTWNKANWWNSNILHMQDRQRGFDAVEALFCPATASVLCNEDFHVTLVASIEQNPWRAHPINRPHGPDKLTTITSHFLVSTPPNLGAGGQNYAGGQSGAGTPGRTTIIAGYPWFTDWGRDTFISLPGLCLTTGREETARQIVRDFAPWVKDGRIPNRFPDDPQKDPPAYNNVDGTLWYVRCIGLCGMTEELRPTLDAILDAHLSGAVGDGIFCDFDGLLRCGSDHTNLTWMDAKVDGVPITPRFDRPVEVQALWIHALTVGGRAAEAERATVSFLEKFVRPDGLGLWDCFFPNGTPDPAIRPGQVIAAALLDLPGDVNQAVLDTATEHLLTPYGLRTLAPSDPAFCRRYEGDGRQRDRIYHQGTVWPWLLGSFLDLYKKVHGADADVSPFLAALETHLNEDYGLGGIAEVFDGDAPHRPNGCPWQAWSLAEYLRHR